MNRVLVLCLLASAAAAQTPHTPRVMVSLVGGISQFDLSGTGTANVFGARVETDVKRWLVLEGALGTFRPTESVGPNRYYIPEAQLQVQIPGRIILPYLGAGGGYFVGTNARPTRGTASLSGGLRANMGDTRTVARAELRVRGIGENFGGSTAEWTLGLGWRF